MGSGQRVTLFTGLFSLSERVAAQSGELEAAVKAAALPKVFRNLLRAVLVCFIGTLLAGQARNYQIDEAAVVHRGSDLRVGRNLVQSFNPQMAVVGYVAFHFIAAIGYGLATRELAADFDIYVQSLGLQDR